MEKTVRFHGNVCSNVLEKIRALNFTGWSIGSMQTCYGMLERSGVESKMCYRRPRILPRAALNRGRVVLDCPGPGIE